MEDKPRFTKKGKEMFNILVAKLGKKKARSIIYSMEVKNPGLIKKWRERWYYIVITKSSWRYDPKAQVYRSGAQGGGYVKYNPSTGQYDLYSSAGSMKGVGIAESYSRRQFERMVEQGQIAERKYNLQRSIQLQKEAIVSDKPRTLAESRASQINKQAAKNAQRIYDNLNEKQQRDYLQRLAQSQNINYDELQSKLDRGRTLKIAVQELNYQKVDKEKTIQKKILNDPSWRTVIKEVGFKKDPRFPSGYSTV